MEVKSNKEIRRVSVEELEEVYRNNKLFLLLHSLSDKELAEARTLVECDDIIGIRIDILLEIQREQSYRKVNVSNLENAYKNNKLDSNDKSKKEQNNKKNKKPIMKRSLNIILQGNFPMTITKKLIAINLLLMKNFIKIF